MNFRHQPSGHIYHKFNLQKGLESIANSTVLPGDWELQSNGYFNTTTLEMCEERPISPYMNIERVNLLFSQFERHLSLSNAYNLQEEIIASAVYVKDMCRQQLNDGLDFFSYNWAIIFVILSKLSEFESRCGQPCREQLALSYFTVTLKISNFRPVFDRTHVQSNTELARAVDRIKYRILGSVNRLDMLSSWFTVVRLQLQMSMTTWSQCLNDLTRKPIEACAFYSELTKRHEEFPIPFGVMDFLQSFEAIPNRSRFGLSKVIQTVRALRLNWNDFARAFNNRFNEFCSYQNDEAKEFLAVLVVETPDHIFPFFQAMMLTTANSLQFLIECYLPIKGFLEIELSRTADLNENAEHIHTRHEVLDICIATVVRERSLEGVRITMSEIFCLYDQKVEGSWKTTTCFFKASIDGPTRGDETWVEIVCTQAVSVSLRLMVGFLEGTFPLSPEVNVLTMLQNFRKLLLLPELRGFLQALSPRILVNRIVDHLSCHGLQAFALFSELLKIFGDCHEVLASKQSVWSHEGQNSSFSPVARLLPTFEDFFSGLGAWNSKELVQLARVVDHYSSSAFWLHFCDCLLQPLQEIGVGRAVADRHLPAIERWANSIAISPSETVPTALAELVDKVLENLLKHFDDAKDIVDVSGLLRILGSAEANVSADACIFYQRYKSAFVEREAKWKQGDLLVGQIKFLLSSPYLGSISKALGIGNILEVIKIQSDKLERSLHLLKDWSAVLDWLARHNVEVQCINIHLLRGEIERTLEFSIPGQRLFEVFQLETDFWSAMNEFEPEVRIFLLHFSVCNSMIFNGLVKRSQDRYIADCVHRGQEVLMEVTKVNRWLKECRSTLKKIVEGCLPFSELEVMQNLVRRLDVQVEISCICDFFLDKDQGNRAQLARSLQRAFQLLQFKAFAQEVVKTLGLFEVVPDTDAEYQELKEISQQIVAVEDIHLDSLVSQLEKLEKWFRGMSPMHLSLFSVLSDSENILYFFREHRFHAPDGRFDDLKQHITASTRGQDFMCVLFGHVVQAHLYCAPFASQSSLSEVLRGVREMRVEKLSQLDCLVSAHRHIAEVRDIFKQATQSTAENTTATMKMLQRSGIARIRLRGLEFASSSYEILYSVLTLGEVPERRESMSQELNGGSQCHRRESMSQELIKELKRQLSFGLDMDSYGELKAFRDQLLALDRLVEKYMELEQLGHPEYQTLQVDIPLQQDEDVGLLQRRTADLEDREAEWAQALATARKQERYLLLWSNKQVMLILKLLADFSGDFVKTLPLPAGQQCANVSTTAAKDQRILVAVMLSSYFQILWSFVLAQQGASAGLPRASCVNAQDVEAALKKRSRGGGGLKSLCRECGANYQRALQLLQELVKDLAPLAPVSAESGNKNQFVHSLAETVPVYAALVKMLSGSSSAQVTSSPQILWCSESTSLIDLDLFFQRVATFVCHSFVVLGVNLLSTTCRQNIVARQEQLHGLVAHGEVHFVYLGGAPVVRVYPFVQTIPNFFDCLLRPLAIRDLGKLLPRPTLRCVVGSVGSGKSHRIGKELELRAAQGAVVHCISLNDEVRVQEVIWTFLSVAVAGRPACLYFNVSSRSPLERINQLLFKLLVTGTLADEDSGVVFSFSECKDWAVIVECPSEQELTVHTVKVEIPCCVKALLPALEILVKPEVVSPSELFDIGEMERFVALYLHASANGHIDHVARSDSDRVSFPTSQQAVATNDCLCRQLIDQVVQQHLLQPHGRSSKFHQRLFLQYLHRRFKYFTGILFTTNTNKSLRVGSTMMGQMLKEAGYLCTQSMACDAHFPHVFLVFDEYLGAIPMYSDDSIWTRCEFDDLRRTTEGFLSDVRDESHVTRWERYVCWALGLHADQVRDCFARFRFVLEEDNAFKLILFHERRLAGLPVILEGETGVGKTFVLEMYCRLLNLKMTTPLKRSVSAALQVEIAGLSELTAHMDVPTICSRLQQEALDDRELEELWANMMLHLADPTRASMLARFKAQAAAWFEEFPLLDSAALRAWMNSELVEGTPADIACEAMRRLLALSTKGIFHHMLVHPGITNDLVELFLEPVVALAVDCLEKKRDVVLVVFFDEVNTASCLGLFKEVMVDHSFRGRRLPSNIFFAAAINPHTGRPPEAGARADPNRPTVSQRFYNVHKLPTVMGDLMWRIAAPRGERLRRFILRKIQLYGSHTPEGAAVLPFDDVLQECFAKMLLESQHFFIMFYGESSVSHRDIQRTFLAITFFWNFFHKNPHHLTHAPQKNGLLENSVRMALALVYYLRLDLEPVKPGSGRSDFAKLMDNMLPPIQEHGILGFGDFVRQQLDFFVRRDHFEIPNGIALNQALKENILALVVCFMTKIPLGIIGAPGSSKTLSFHVIRDNLRGDHAPRAFCRQFHAVDPFFYQCSEFTTSAEVEGVLLRALDREGQYERLGSRSRCLVFLDEAGLPDVRKMELKVLHPYLDDAKVAFVAISNQHFDAANRNRMLTVTRSVATLDDLEVLARGCLGLHDAVAGDLVSLMVRGLCQGFLRVIALPNNHFHYRDLVYVCRCLLRRTPECKLCTLDPVSLLRALEENMNGMEERDFAEVVRLVFNAICEVSGQDFPEPSACQFRDAISLIRNSLSPRPRNERTDPELMPRYKLIIDPSDDSSAVRLLFDLDLVPPEATSASGVGTHVLTLGEFGGNADMRCAELVSRVKVCMERGHTVLLVHASRIHGSLYDLLNQQFRKMPGLDGRDQRVYANVAIGAQTYPCPVHPNFMCVVHLTAQEKQATPAPFLSRFEKFILSAEHLLGLSVRQLSDPEQRLVALMHCRAEAFVRYLGQAHIYGFTEGGTIPSLLLSCIRKQPPATDGSVGGIYLDEACCMLGDIWQDGSREASAVRWVCAQLLQLVPPEVVINKLQSMGRRAAAFYRDSYFVHNEHFSLAGFARGLLEQELAARTSGGSEFCGSMYRKHVLFARTNAAVLSMTETLAIPRDLHDKMVVVACEREHFESQVTFEQRLEAFAASSVAQVALVVVAVREFGPGHRNLLRQLVDRVEAQSNAPPVAGTLSRPGKFLLLLFHFPPQELAGRCCHAAMFLRNWKFHFFDVQQHDNPIDMRALAALLSLPAPSPSVGRDSTSEFVCEDAKNDGEPIFHLERLRTELLWDFCVRLRVMGAARLTVEGPGRSVLALYNARRQPAERLKAIEAGLYGLDVLERFGRAFYTAKGRKYARARLVETARRLVEGHDMLRAGFAEAVAARVRSDFFAFVGSALRRLCSEYGLFGLARLAETRTPAALAYAREAVAVAELPETMDFADAGGGYDGQVLLVNCSLEFTPQMPFFGALLRNIEQAREDLRESADAAVARERGRNNGSKAAEALLAALDNRFARLRRIPVTAEAWGSEGKKYEKRAGDWMLADFLGDLATWKSAALLGTDCESRTHSAAKAALLSRLQHAMAAYSDIGNVLKGVVLAHQFVSENEKHLRLLCRASLVAAELGQSSEIPADANLQDWMAAIVAKGAEELARKTGGGWAELCERWVRAMELAVRGGEVDRSRLVALSTLALFLRSRDGLDAAALRGICGDLHHLAVSPTRAGENLVASLLTALAARLGVEVRCGDKAVIIGLIKHTQWNGHEGRVLQNQVGGRYKVLLHSGIELALKPINLRKPAGWRLCGDALLWNARLVSGAMRAEEAAAQMRDVLGVLNHPAPGLAPVQAASAAFDLLVAEVPTNQRGPRVWEPVDQVLAGAGDKSPTPDQGYLPPTFVLAGERAALPPSLTCPLADVVFSHQLREIQLCAASPAADTTVADAATPEAKTKADGALKLMELELARTDRRRELHILVRRAAANYRILELLGSFLARLNPADLSAYGHSGEWALVARFSLLLSTSANWRGLLVATVARHAGEAQVAALVRADAFSRQAGGWAVDMAAQLAQRDMRAALAQKAMDEHVAEGHFRFRCPHCRTPFVDKVEGTCNLMRCGRNVHDDETNHLLKNIQPGYGCGQKFYFQNGIPLAVPFVSELPPVPPMPPALTLVDQAFAAGLVQIEPPSMDAFLDALRERTPIVGAGVQLSPTEHGGVLDALVVRSLHAIPMLQLAPPLAALLIWLQRHAAFRYSHAQLMGEGNGGGVTFRQLLSEVGKSRASCGLRAEKFFTAAMEAFNEYHRKVGGQVNPGACEGPRQKFDRLTPDSPLRDFATMADEGAPCLLLTVLEKLVLTHNEVLQRVTPTSATDPAVRRILEACCVGRVSLEDLAEPGGPDLLLSVPSSHLLPLVRAYAATGADAFDWAGLERAVALWFLAGQRCIETHSAGRPLPLRRQERRPGADMLAGLQLLVGEPELPEAVQLSAAALLQDMRREDLQRALRDLDRVAAAAVLNITLPSDEDDTTAVVGNGRERAQAVEAMELGTFLSAQVMKEQRRAEVQGVIPLGELVESQAEVGELCKRLGRITGLQLRHAAALAALVRQRIQDPRYLFAHLPIALQHSLSTEGQEAISAVLRNGGITAEMMNQAAAQLSESQEFFVRFVDRPLRGVMVDYVCLGDASEAPLLALLPDQVLCCHAAALGVQLLAVQDLLRAQESIERRERLVSWEDLPLGGPVVVAEPDPPSEPEEEEVKSEAQSMAMYPDFWKPPPSLPSQLPPPEETLGFDGGRGEEDNWDLIKGPMVNLILLNYRCHIARRRTNHMLKDRRNADWVRTESSGCIAAKCAAAAARENWRHGRRMAARLQTAWRSFYARHKVESIRKARESVVICTLQLRLVPPKPIEMLKPPPAGKKRFVVTLADHIAEAIGKKGDRWLCEFNVLPGKVQLLVSRSCCGADLPWELDSVQAEKAACGVVMVDGYGAAADPAASPSDLLVVTIGELVRVKVKVLSSSGGDAVGEQDLEKWFWTESTVKKVTERFRIELGRLEPTALDVLNEQGSIVVQESKLGDIAVDGPLGVRTARLTLDMRGLPGVEAWADDRLAAQVSLAAGSEDLRQAVCQTLGLNANATIFPPVPSEVTMGKLLAWPGVRGCVENLAAELIVVLGDALVSVAAGQQQGWVLRGCCPPRVSGGLTVVSSSDAPMYSVSLGVLKSPASARCGTVAAVWEEELPRGLNHYVWPVGAETTARDVIEWLAMSGVVDGWAATEGVLIGANGTAFGPSALLAGVGRVRLVRRGRLLRFLVAAGDGHDVQGLVYAAPDSQCTALRDAAAVACGLQSEGLKLCCGGLVVPEDWRAADLPQVVHCVGGGSMLSLAHSSLPRSTVLLRLDLDSEAGCPQGYGRSAVLVACPGMGCQHLLDALAAPHGGGSGSCALWMELAGEEPSHVDTGTDGQGGLLLESLVEALLEEGQTTALLRVSPEQGVFHISTTLRLVGATAEAPSPRGIYAWADMRAEELCLAALGAHGVAVPPGVLVSCKLFFRETGSETEESVEAAVTMSEIHVDMQDRERLQCLFIIELDLAAAVAQATEEEDDHAQGWVEIDSSPLPPNSDSRC